MIEGREGEALDGLPSAGRLEGTRGLGEALGLEEDTLLPLEGLEQLGAWGLPTGRHTLSRCRSP